LHTSSPAFAGEVAAKRTEGFFTLAKNPSTMLRMVPLPTKSWGG
jgi:hypothetical protein